MKASIRKNTLKKGFSYTVFIDYGIVNGSRKREPLETFSKKADAEAYKADVQAKINNNNFVHVTDMSFSELIDEWMQNHIFKSCELNTYETYKIINETYIKPCLGHIPAKILSSQDGISIINDYYKYLRFELENDINPKTKRKRKNLSFSTVEHHKAQISGAMTYGMSVGKLVNNSCLKTTIPKTDEEKMKDVIIDDIENYEDDDLYEDEEFLTPEQAVQVLNLFMNTSMMLPVFLAALLGLRRSEVAGILKSKVDKEKQRICINASRVNCGKKTVFKKRNKNKSSTRFLYLPNILLKILELDEKRRELNKLEYGNKYVDSNFLCVNDDGTPLRVSYISERFKKTFDKFIREETEKAKNNNEDFKFPYITYHSLRHLNISSLLANGAYLTDVKDNSGHSNINTTLHYTHQYTIGKKEIANKTDEIYSSLLEIKTS